MFWRVGGLSMASPIDTILDKSSFTLEELLEEDDLIQECRSLNGRLISFLGKKHNVEAMLKYMLDPGLQKKEEQNPKLSWQSCEVFCCEADPIFSVLLENEDIMSKFLGTLDHPGSLDSTIAWYFGRVMNHLLLRKAPNLAEYLMSKEDSLQKFIEHLEDTSIVEVVIKLLGADEQTNVQLPESYKQWLLKTEALEWVLQRLDSKEQDPVQTNASQVLIAIIKTQSSWLAEKLAGSKFLDQLLQYLVEEDGEISVPILNVCIAAMDPKRRLTDGVGLLTSLNGNLSMTIDRPLDNPFFQPLLYKLIVLLPQMVSKLSDLGSNSTAQTTPYGKLVPPLGQARLKLIEMVAILVNTKINGCLEAIMESKALEISLELFVKYPFNNILHKHVTSILITIIKSQSLPLLKFLFEKLELLKWIITIPQVVDVKLTQIQFSQPEKKTGSSKKAQTGLRVGYLGHVLTISNQILKSVEFNEYIESIVMKNEDWQKYVNSELKSSNEKSDLRSWKCGRPSDGLSRDQEEEDHQDPGLLISSNGRDYNQLCPDEDEQDEDLASTENTLNWHSITGVLTSEDGDVTGTVAMMSRMALNNITAASDAAQTTRNDSTSSSSSSHDSGSQSSSSIDSGSSDDEMDYTNEEQSTEPTDGVWSSHEDRRTSASGLADEFSSFNFWKVDFPDVDLPE